MSFRKWTQYQCHHWHPRKFHIKTKIILGLWHFRRRKEKGFEKCLRLIVMSKSVTTRSGQTIYFLIRCEGNGCTVWMHVTRFWKVFRLPEIVYTSNFIFIRSMRLKMHFWTSFAKVIHNDVCSGKYFSVDMDLVCVNFVEHNPSQSKVEF